MKKKFQVLVVLGVLLSTSVWADHSTSTSLHAYVRSIVANSVLAPSKKVEAYQSLVQIFRESGLEDSSTREQITGLVKSSPQLRERVSSVMGADYLGSDAFPGECTENTTESDAEGLCSNI